jgi:hypothetical protein
MKKEALVVRRIDGNEPQKNTSRSLFKLENEAVLSQTDVFPNFSLQLGLLNVLIYRHAANVGFLELNSNSKVLTDYGVKMPEVE